MYGEGVEGDKKDIDYIRFFCGNSEIPQDLKDREGAREPKDTRES